MKDMLRKEKDKAGATPYFDLKQWVLLHFGASEEENYVKAAALQSTFEEMKKKTKLQSQTKKS